jgi:hypothetical protein
MKLKLLIVFIICSLSAFGEIKSDTIKNIESVTPTAQVPVSINLPQTIKIEDVTEKIDNESFWERNIAWIIAFLIGIISAAVNIWAAYQLRKSNEQNLKLQIESLEKTTIMQYKATISTKNRQEWINELRQTLTDFLTYAMYLTPTTSASPLLDKEESKRYLEKVINTKSKIELLVNESKPEQKELINAVEKMIDLCTKKAEECGEKEIRNTRKEIIASARNLFGIHWTKIKDLK